jgi:ABC-type sugar transport system ATPase subunit
MDIFAGEFVGSGDSLGYQVGEARVPVPAAVEPPARPVDMGVRPEFVNMGGKGFDASVRLVQPVGPFTYVTVEWNGGSVTARVNGVSHLRPGEAVRVEFDPEGLLFFDRGGENRLDL